MADSDTEFVSHQLRDSYYYDHDLYTPEDDRVPIALKERDITLYGDPDAPDETGDDADADLGVTYEDGWPVGFPETGRLESAGVDDFEDLTVYVENGGEIEDLNGIGEKTAPDIAHAYEQIQAALAAAADETDEDTAQ